MFKLHSFLTLLFVFTIISTENGVKADFTCGNDGISCGQIVEMYIGFVIGFAVVATCINEYYRKKARISSHTSTTAARDDQVTELSTSQDAFDLEAAHSSPPKELLWWSE